MEQDLIIDVGMHDGQDTAFYLDKGFRVVAIEANPDLVADAATRFSRQIDDGRLRLIGAAIAEERGTISMGISDEMTAWSLAVPEFVARNQAYSGTKYRFVDVPTIPFEDVLENVGIPTTSRSISRATTCSACEPCVSSTRARNIYRSSRT